MIKDILTKIIDFIFRNKIQSQEQEKIYWEHHWERMIEYFKKNKEIFEINNEWDFYCNKELHEHYKSLIGHLRNLSCIECGCGGGYESCLMAKEGAKVSILDFSKKALEYAQIVANRLNIKNEIGFICKNIMNFENEAIYDLAWNCGVIEHYSDTEAIEIIKRMKLLIKRNGRVIITVPNLLSPELIYRILKEGKGSERYISHKKLKNLMMRAGLKNIKIYTLNYFVPSFLPYSWANKTRGLKITNIVKPLAWLFSGMGNVN